MSEALLLNLKNLDPNLIADYIYNLILKQQELTQEIEKLRDRGADLSDTEIIQELDQNIIIHPFKKSQLNATSYNVTLGSYYYRSTSKPPAYFAMGSGKHIAEYWNVRKTSDGLYGAQKAMKISDPVEAKLYGVNVDDEIILLEPGELILGHTEQFIGGRANITTQINAKSTAGRTGRSVCKCASCGSPNYTNRWTLELENHTKTIIVLVVGEEIAQITFRRTGKVTTQYKGQYQKTDNMEELEKTWNPSMMIPSAGIKYVDFLYDYNV